MRPSKSEIIERLLDPGLIAVVRAKRRDQVIPLAEALVASGVIAVEITMTTPDAILAIQEACEHFGDRASIGVGTILSQEDCEAALNAGAQFVVTPILKTEFVPIVHRFDRPIMLGSYAPTEAQTAHEAGADFIKVFPAEGLGPNYIKAIRAPLPHLKIVPTGGVNLDTIESFLGAGCVALGVGSSMITKEILASDGWDDLTRLAGQFVSKVKEVRGNGE